MIWNTAFLPDPRWWSVTTSSAGANRKKSEKYGFVVPLRPDLHPNGANFKRTPENMKIDLFLKQEAQLHYEESIGSREDFRREFGKSWL